MRAKSTPNDPERRERIIEATMALLLEDGLSAVSARAVAQRIGVPVGSVSYYFDSVRALLLEASRRILTIRTSSLHAWSTTAGDATLSQHLAALIHKQITDGRAVTSVAYELFILGLRDPEVREISDTVTQELAAALCSHVPEGSARAVAAAADGVQMHALMRERTPTVEDLTRDLDALLAVQPAEN